MPPGRHGTPNPRSGGCAFPTMRTGALRSGKTCVCPRSAESTNPHDGLLALGMWLPRVSRDPAQPASENPRKSGSRRPVAERQGRCAHELRAIARAPPAAPLLAGGPRPCTHRGRSLGGGCGAGLRGDRRSRVRRGLVGPCGRSSGESHPARLRETPAARDNDAAGRSAPRPPSEWSTPASWWSAPSCSAGPSRSCCDFRVRSARPCSCATSRARTPQQIAASTNTKVATVKTRLRRGLERLRERMDEATGGDRAAWSAALALAVPTAAESAPILSFVERVSWPWRVVGVVAIGTVVFLGVRVLRSDPPGDRQVAHPELECSVEFRRSPWRQLRPSFGRCATRSHRTSPCRTAGGGGRNSTFR